MKEQFRVHEKPKVKGSLYNKESLAAFLENGTVTTYEDGVQSVIPVDLSNMPQYDGMVRKAREEGAK